MHSNLFVTTNTEGSDSVAGLACEEELSAPISRKLESRLECNGNPTVDRSLTTQLFQHLGGTSKSVTRLSNRDVEDELLDTEFPHGVSTLVSGFSHFD